MRISDWSSDVCSSDLAVAVATASAPDAASVQDDRLLFAMEPGRLLTAGLFNFSLAALAVVGAAMQLFDGLLPFDFNIFDPMDWIDIAEDQGLDQWLLAHRWIAGIGAALSLRSEEHTSELQSLMRISYAV